MKRQEGLGLGSHTLRQQQRYSRLKSFCLARDERAQSGGNTDASEIWREDMDRFNGLYD